MKYLQFILDHKEEIGSTAVLLYEVVIRLIPTAKSWSIIPLLVKIFSLIPDKKADGGTHAAPGKEAGAATVVTSPNGTSPVSSSLPVIILLFTAGMLSGCARKVATQKSIVNTMIDSVSHAVDTTKRSSTSTYSIERYYGDTISGNVYVLPDTAVTPTLQYTNINSGGINMRIALVKAGAGYKALYTVVSKPVKTVESGEQQQTDNEGKTSDVKLDKKESSGSTVKQVKSSGGYPVLWVWVAALLVVAAALLWAYRKKLKNLFAHAG